MNQEQRELLMIWHQALENAKIAKIAIEHEQELRKQVSALFFPEPVEGVNIVDLSEGWKLKFTHKLTYKLDEAGLNVAREELRKIGINPDPLVKFKPEVELKAYKALRKINIDASNIFDQCLTITPAATPTLELIEPKEGK